ncbi:hydroxypyruvate isomerase family protein [Neobacillus dielmonensis]|uniref:hydroxypyruvate isomerase family protein n=1 Tax=Neobacillus dielmonensis TaxID=1347369 RepID=UPI0005AAE49C|nr:TIM barrel protein [Neobacillus dielmonensis]
MTQFAVNLSTIFQEVTFLERFKKARNCGFSYVECQFPYAYSIEEINQVLTQQKLKMVLLNLPPGNWEKGDRGIAIDPNRIEEFRCSVKDGIRYALGLNVPHIHCMAGILSETDPLIARDVYLENLYYAGTELAKHGLILMIEPINPYDMPGYFLNDIGFASDIIQAVNLPNIMLQFDFYHIQQIQGSPLVIYQQYADMIGHIQIADVPGRHQPGTGEMDYQKIFAYLNNTYHGYIGLEYIPDGRSENSFEWLPRVGEGDKIK